MARPLILIVEDNPNDEEMVMSMLVQAQLAEHVKIISDGEKAARYLTENPAEAEELLAIFLDLNLPMIDGIELLKLIRAGERTKHLPVIVMTSSDYDADLKRCQKYGVHSYVQKPVTFTAFASAIANTFRLVSDPSRFESLRHLSE